MKSLFKNILKPLATAILLFPLLTMLPSYAMAQQGVAAPAVGAEIAEYDQLVKNSYAMPANLDFQHARDLYTKLPGYSAYGVLFVEDFKQFSRRVDAGDPGVAEDLKKYSARHFALPEVHTRTIGLFEKLGDNKSAQYEEWLARQLIPTLMHSGDGAAAETAYKVIVVSEEYMLARPLVEKVTSQRLEQKGGHVFDVLSGQSKKTGMPVDIWYNIDPIWAAKL